MDLRKFRLRVPATTANLGPGFDCIGMALSLHNEIQFEEGKFNIELYGEGEGVISKNEDNYIYRSIRYLFGKLNKPAPPLHIKCYNQIPLFRGLGSSAAAIVAGLYAANVLCDKPFVERELLKFAFELEGHPDNVVAAALGGCQLSVIDGGELYYSRVSIPDSLTAVVFIPDFKMPTSKSRAVLPHNYTREDAVFNISRAALLVNCLAAQQLDLLKIATKDKMHQPARSEIFPAMPLLFEAALEQGALGVFLSGGGSTILALTTDNAGNIGEAMKSVGEKFGVTGSVKALKPCKEGLTIEV